MNSGAILGLDQLIVDAIHGAGEISDPLMGLAEKTAADPSAPFMPEALKALAALKSANRAAFEDAALAAQESRVPAEGAR